VTTARPIEREAVALAVATLLARKKQSNTRYVDDPVGFINERLGEHLWSKQREVAESVLVNRHTLVKSAHDQGKSFVASRDRKSVV